jgi:MFS family permease
MATEQGRAGWPFVLLMIFSWGVGGIGGGVVGGIVLDGSQIGFIAGYVLGVIAACVLNTLIVSALTEREKPRQRGWQQIEPAYEAWRRRKLEEAKGEPVGERR